MAMYEKQLTIDISGEGPYKHITAKQGDKKSRFYRITLVDCGKKISLTEKEKVDFRCTKPDENYCIIPTTKNADGTVSFELDEQILAVVGVAVSEFVITDDNGMILSTTVFYIHVLPSALSGYYIPSQSLQIMDRNLDMSGYGIHNLPIPNKNGDAVNKGYVDELLKNVKVPVDAALDENSTNAIQNAVVAKEAQNIKKYVDDEATKKWYVMPVGKFKENPTSLYCNIRKTSFDNGYCAIVGFYFHHAERGQDGEEIVIKPLTDIPFELGLKDNGDFTEWLNKDKFPAFGIINTQMGKYPVDLYEQLKAFVDGTTFYNAEILDFGPTGNSTIYYDFDCSVALYSHSEVAIDAFIEEITLLIPTITHCCIEYDNYQIVEANTLEVE